MPDEKERQVTVGVQFPKEMRQWIIQESEKQGTSFSYIVRTAVKEKMEQEEIK